MTDILNFYIDDSGTRHPTRRRGTVAGHGYDWFALGGVLIRDRDEESARTLHAAFMARWSITSPLHSSEIRSQKGSFAWLRGLSAPDEARFYEELFQFLIDVPVIGLACVIDRPGYSARYLDQYDQKPWMLCRTAFSVVVERAAKYARQLGARLRIAPERCNRTEDAWMKGYYNALKEDGMPFAAQNCDKYGPLSPSDFRKTLYEFRLKAKSSPMAQLADLYLWPICVGGYHLSNRPYARLFKEGKLIESRLPEDTWSVAATKYSCFDSVARKP